MESIIQNNNFIARIEKARPQDEDGLPAKKVLKLSFDTRPCPAPLFFTFNEGKDVDDDSKGMPNQGALRCRTFNDDDLQSLHIYILP